MGPSYVIYVTPFGASQKTYARAENLAKSDFFGSHRARMGKKILFLARAN